MENDEMKLLVKIAQMYYQEDKNQSQISKELNIHRSTISRLLKQSRMQGIVTISINYDKTGTYSLEEELKKKFQLIGAVVVPMASEIDDEQRMNLLGKAANDYVHTILEDGMIVGFSWGRAMAAFARSLKDFHLKDITCVPMVGGPAGRLESDFHVNTITYEASKNLHGRALLIDAPAFPETVSLKKALMENDFNQKLIEYWRKLDVAIFGIGSPSLKKSSRWRNFYGDDVFEFVEENEVVGDIVSRFFDKDGNHISSQLDDRLVGIDITELKRAHFRICLVDSVEKTEAVKGALKGGYINILVLTQEIAEQLL
jgi:DNA-binding transcriptional regulator LsrR (DeoR family)